MLHASFSSSSSSFLSSSSPSSSSSSSSSFPSSSPSPSSSSPSSPSSSSSCFPTVLHSCLQLCHSLCSLVRSHLPLLVAVAVLRLNILNVLNILNIPGFLVAFLIVNYNLVLYCIQLTIRSLTPLSAPWRHAPDLGMSVPDLIESSGYSCQTHEVVTEDGYLLQLHRIPGPGPAVLLQHGMLCSSYCWVTSDSSSLGFILADRGFDVWLGNFRGTRYGRRHTCLDPDTDLEFWRFTLHELGVYDLAATISSVLAISGRTRLSFIGHSMGTTAYLILASSLPERVAAVSRAVLLAPVVEPHNMRNLVGRLAALHRLYRWLFESVGVLEILPSSILVERLTWDTLVHHCLRLSLFATGGQEDTRRLERIVHHAKSSKTSFYTVLHYAQNISDKVFRAYDWGEEVENRRRYGSPSPPLYQLGRVQTETCLFWSPQDSLSSREDMQRLAGELPNILACREVSMGHLEYLWGNNFRKQELYSDLISLLQMDGQSKEQSKEKNKDQSKEQNNNQNKEQSKDGSNQIRRLESGLETLAGTR